MKTIYDIKYRIAECVLDMEAKLMRGPAPKHSGFPPETESEYQARVISFHQSTNWMLNYANYFVDPNVLEALRNKVMFEREVRELRQAQERKRTVVQ